MTAFDQLAAAAQDAVARVGGLDGRFLLPALALQLATLGFRAVAWTDLFQGLLVAVALIALRMGDSSKSVWRSGTAAPKK